MSEDTPQDGEYPKECGNSSTIIPGYSVEARHRSKEPRKIAGQIFDDRWRRVQFSEAECGIPSGSAFHLHNLKEYGLFNYSTAQALRWWLHAIADSESALSGICLETKLIKHVVNTSSNCQAKSEHDIISGDNRSNIMPDWGDKT